MSKQRNDEGLRDDALSRVYRQAATDEPPPALDALILSAARREAAQRPPVRSVPWWRRALAPVGILATIVLTVSLTLMVQHEQQDMLPAAAPAPARVVDQAKRLAEPAAKPVARVDSKAKKEQARPAQAPAASAPVASAPAPVLREAAPEAPPVAEPKPPAESLQSQAPASLPAPAPMMMRKAAPEAKSVDEASKPSDAAGFQERSRAVMSAPRRDSAADKPIRTPEDWIEDIRRLKREGREPEAKVQLTAFRRAYPDYLLPDDLKAP
jgi:hypothetical protein